MRPPYAGGDAESMTRPPAAVASFVFRFIETLPKKRAHASVGRDGICDESRGKPSSRGGAYRRKSVSPTCGVDSQSAGFGARNGLKTAGRRDRGHSPTPSPAKECRAAFNELTIPPRLAMLNRVDKTDSRALGDDRAERADAIFLRRPGRNPIWLTPARGHIEIFPAPPAQARQSGVSSSCGGQWRHGR